MSEELEKLENALINDPWKRRDDESAADYATFTEYCKLGSSRRSYRLLAAHLGISISRIQAAARRNSWSERADQWDRASNALTPIALSLEDTLAFQAMIGKAMLDMGIAALQLKNPGSMKTSDVVRLLKEGSDMQRRAMGLNDTVNVNIETNAVQKINSLLGEIGMIEAEAVEDDDDS